MFFNIYFGKIIDRESSNFATSKRVTISFYLNHGYIYTQRDSATTCSVA